MDHDPLCRNTNWTPWTDGARCPVCDDYARVRADERHRMTLPEWAQVVLDARRAVAEEIVAALLAYSDDVMGRADDPGHFGNLTTGQAVGIALATTVGIARRFGGAQ